MKGLEAIKDRILSQAREQARIIAESGDRQAQDIIAESVRQATDNLEKHAKADSKDVEAVLMRDRSLAISESRQIILSCKQNLIDETIDEAIASLSRMSDDEKTALYAGMLRKHLVGGETVKFCLQDGRLAGQLSAVAGVSFNVDPEPGVFSGGFVVSGEMVEINLTFDMIVRQYRNELVAIAASALFEGQN
ncbi:MAG: V-type ATP synthase subunit E [Saccharofermentanales bacterium]